jgi:hypothetical protein
MIQGTMTGVRTGIHLIALKTIPSGLGGDAGNVIPHLIELPKRMAPEASAVRGFSHSDDSWKASLGGDTPDRKFSRPEVPNEKPPGR